MCLRQVKNTKIDVKSVNLVHLSLSAKFFCKNFNIDNQVFEYSSLCKRVLGGWLEEVRGGSGREGVKYKPAFQIEYFDLTVRTIEFIDIDALKVFRHFSVEHPTKTDLRVLHHRH